MVRGRMEISVYARRTSSVSAEPDRHDLRLHGVQPPRLPAGPPGQGRNNKRTSMGNKLNWVATRNAEWF